MKPLSLDCFRPLPAPSQVPEKAPLPALEPGPRTSFSWVSSFSSFRLFLSNPLSLDGKPTTKGYTLLFLRYKHGYRKDTFAKAHSSLAALYGNIIPYPSVEWQGFPWICLDTFCSLSWIHALILYFSDKNAPVSVPGGGRHRGYGALDKLGRDCYHRRRKSVATSGWLFVSANNYIYADRLAATQAVSTLLWKVPVLKTPRTAEISKKICPFQLHPLPTWILRGASQPLFVTTLLSGPFDGAFLS